ncbi:MAG: hypothetical protein QXK76_02660 [Candidatus Woesearchaeota archaeon]
MIITSDTYFDDIIEWIKIHTPERTIKGILLIMHLEIHDVAPDKRDRESNFYSYK